MRCVVVGELIVYIYIYLYVAASNKNKIYITSKQQAHGGLDLSGGQGGADLNYGVAMAEQSMKELSLNAIAQVSTSVAN